MVTTSAKQRVSICVGKDTTADAVSVNLGWEARRKMIISKPNPVGTFSFCLLLKHLFGFCDDYTKVIYSVKHSLLLCRQSDNDAIFRDNAVAAGRITLSKLSWLMPHVTPSIEQMNMLNKQIENKIKIPVAFRAMQCDSLAVPQATSFSLGLGVKSDTE